MIGRMFKQLMSSVSVVIHELRMIRKILEGEDDE